MRIERENYIVPSSLNNITRTELREASILDYGLYFTSGIFSSTLVYYRFSEED
jgi:hypothetical protein